MARRFSTPYQSEPVSRLATWSRNLAIFAVVAVVVSILIVRFGFLEMKPALATFFGALGCAVLSMLVGFAAFAAIWQNGSRGMGRIEAGAATPIMRFGEDRSIRMTPDDEESRVDIRSSSRYFESDLGSNAARVSKLIEEINAAVDNAKPAQKKPQAPAKVPA